MNIIPRFFLGPFIGTLLLAASCQSSNENNLSCDDRIVLFDMALKSKYFKASYAELRPASNTIYIVDTAKQESLCKLVSESSMKIKYTDSFNADRTFIEQAADKRFLISNPAFAKSGDTTRLSFLLHNFYSELEFRFVKTDDRWKMVFENEKQW